MGFDFAATDDTTEEYSADSPSFPDDLGPSAFRSACEEYAEWSVGYYDEFDEVTLDTVTIQVSEKLKRAAGKAGEGRSNIPTEWFMRFAYGAYEKWGWGEEVEATIRHELVHIKQFQTTGTGGHGPDFHRMADTVDAPRNCKKFTDFNFGVYCSDCDELVAGRYRSCKLTKKAAQYRSKCCNEECYSEKL